MTNLGQVKWILRNALIKVNQITFGVSVYNTLNSGTCHLAQIGTKILVQFSHLYKFFSN